MEKQKIVNDEQQRLTSLLFSYGVTKERIELLTPIIENVAWMRVKLDDTREIIKDSGVAIQYDNGGGQKGIRESPLFKGYQSLWKSYMAGMEQIMTCLPKEEEKPDMADAPKTVLELVRSKHQKNA